MNEITEQEVMQHAVSDNLILWQLIHNLIVAVNECNQSRDENRAHTLAGKTEATTILMSELLTASAREVYAQKVSDQQQLRLSEIDHVPKFGEQHA